MNYNPFHLLQMEYTKYRKLIQGLFIIKLLVWKDIKNALESGLKFSGRAGLAVLEPK